jgi:hypothetical protein
MGAMVALSGPICNRSLAPTGKLGGSASLTMGSARPMDPRRPGRAASLPVALATAIRSIR